MFISLIRMCLLVCSVPKALQYCKTDVFLPPKAPITYWGANWPGVLTDPSCPGEEDFTQPSKQASKQASKQECEVPRQGFARRFGARY